MGERFEGMCPHCKGKEKDGEPCKFCKGKGFLNFEMADQKSVDYLSCYVEVVMGAIEKVCDIKGAWISDESSISDFPIEDKELKLLEDELGFPVQYEDKIVDVAKRLKNA